MASTKTVTFFTTRTDTGAMVLPGDRVTTFRDEEVTFIGATSCATGSKSGKIHVRYDSGAEGYYYDGVCGLRVQGILPCGCPVHIVETEGHQEGCSERT